MEGKKNPAAAPVLDVEQAPSGHLLTAALNFSVCTGPVVLRFSNQTTRKGEVMAGKDLYEWVCRLLCTDIVPPMSTDTSDARPSVRVRSTGPGYLELLLAPQPDWPGAFYLRSWLRIRSGPGAVPMDVAAWERAMQAQVDWNLLLRPFPSPRSSVGEAVPWLPWPIEGGCREYKACLVWWTQTADLVRICRNHFGDFARSHGELELTIGIDDSTLLPLGVLLYPSAERVACDLSTALARLLSTEFFPPVEVTDLSVTAFPVVSPDLDDLVADPEKSIDVSEAPCLLKDMLKKSTEQVVLVEAVERGHEEDPPEVRELTGTSKYFLAVPRAMCEEGMVPARELGDSVSVMTRHVVQAQVQLTADTARPCCLAMDHADLKPKFRTILPKIVPRGKDKLSAGADGVVCPVSLWLRFTTGQRHVKDYLQGQQFHNVLLYHEKAPPHPDLQGLLALDTSKNDPSLVTLGAPRGSRMILAFLFVTKESLKSLDFVLCRYCHSVTGVCLRLLLLTYQVDSVLPYMETLRQLELSDPKVHPVIADVVVLPSVRCFLTEAISAGFQVFSGVKKSLVDREALHHDVRDWISTGTAPPAKALALGLVPQLNGQHDSMLREINQVFSKDTVGAVLIEVGQMFRRSGCTTFLRQLAVDAAMAHEELIFLDKGTGGASWTKELVELFACHSTPVVVVAEGKEAGLFEGMPCQSRVIVLTSSYVPSSFSEPTKFIVSPIVSCDRVSSVCLALAHLYPESKEALEELRKLSKAGQDHHRHILMFVVGALRGVAYLNGLEAYVQDEYNQLSSELRPRDSVNKLLTAVAFLGYYARGEHRFLPVRHDQFPSCLNQLTGAGSLLYVVRSPTEYKVAVWHPWVAKQLMLVMGTQPSCPELLGARLLDVLYEIDSMSRAEAVLNHLLFDRGKASFTRLVSKAHQWLVDTGHDLVFSIDDLARYIRDREEAVQFRAHALVLRSRIYRLARMFEEAEDSAKEALECSSDYSVLHNLALVYLSAAAASESAEDFETWLTELVKLYPAQSVDGPYWNTKLQNTAARFIRKLPKRQVRLRWAERFGLPVDRVQPKESWESPPHTILNRAPPHMPAMLPGELAKLSAVAELTE